MPMVGRPKLAKTLPKVLPADAVTALLAALRSEPQPRRRTDWMQRDRALILTALLAGLRADELVRANVGDLRRTDDGAVLHVRGKGGKDRRIPVEPALVDVIEGYLDTRAARFPAAAKRRSSTLALLVSRGSVDLYASKKAHRKIVESLEARSHASEVEFAAWRNDYLSAS
jgi:site-specific recombinase XerD